MAGWFRFTFTTARNYSPTPSHLGSLHSLTIPSPPISFLKHDHGHDYDRHPPHPHPASLSGSSAFLTGLDWLSPAFTSFIFGLSASSDLSTPSPAIHQSRSSTGGASNQINTRERKDFGESSPSPELSPPLRHSAHRDSRLSFFCPFLFRPCAVLNAVFPSGLPGPSSARQSPLEPTRPLGMHPKYAEYAVSISSPPA